MGARARADHGKKSAWLFHLVTVSNGGAADPADESYITRFPGCRIPPPPPQGVPRGERKTWNVNLIAGPFSALPPSPSHPILRVVPGARGGGWSAGSPSVVSLDRERKPICVFTSKITATVTGHVHTRAAGIIIIEYRKSNRKFERTGRRTPTRPRIHKKPTRSP